MYTPYEDQNTWHHTTILSVRKQKEVVIASDGQVSLGATILKGNAKKIRRIGVSGNILVGFAGATADALALLERFEMKLEQHPHQLQRACLELAKEWRTDRYLRRLEAMMAVVDKKIGLIVTGNGDVLEPEDSIIALGSGGPYALAAARALYPLESLDATTIVSKALEITADICIYTNHTLTLEKITCD